MLGEASHLIVFPNSFNKFKNKKALLSYPLFISSFYKANQLILPLINNGARCLIKYFQAQLIRYRYHGNDLKLRGRGHFDNVTLSPSTGIFVNIIYAEIICRVGFNGWMDELRLNVPFNRISFISGRCKGEHEKLCAMKRRLGSEIISPPAGLEPENL